MRLRNALSAHLFRLLFRPCRFHYGKRAAERSPIFGRDPRGAADRSAARDRDDGERRGEDKYCEWCLKFFGTLKEVISDVNNMTREQLENGLQLVCKYLEDDCPWMEQFCEDFGPELIDLLFAYIKEVDAEIQPLHDCKLLFACWGRESDRKLALQRLLVQNRVRLD
ncbi:hypothetical protein M3Y99_01707600 [Aphelenchoides fujianensis]|nr:hypothetical protein M3Y99_01707600 [Aphelenchoides fujianensis]